MFEVFLVLCAALMLALKCRLRCKTCSQCTGGSEVRSTEESASGCSVLTREPKVRRVSPLPMS
jgi:hypothetical protein